MQHDDLRELVALYALDALPDAERAAVERHLDVCPECTGELAAFRAAAAELAYTAPARTAPAALRTRVLAAIDREASATPVPAAAPRPAWNPWWLAAAAILAAVLVGGYALALRAHVNFLDQELREARAQAETAQRQLVDLRSQLTRTEVQLQRVGLTTTILSSPDVIKVDLKGQPAAPAAAGRAFYSGTRGTIFTATALPPLPSSQVYQLWIVTAAGPLSAGLLSPDPQGSALVVAGTTAPQPPAAFAVTVEPAGGVPAPTGARVLVGGV
jgi:anti-sigma-K factor RskA